MRLLFLAIFLISIHTADAFNIVVPNDPGVVTLVSPSLTGCYSNSVPVVVTIQNFGNNSLSNIPVVVIISGPINQTLNANFIGNLAPGSTTNLNVGAANLSWGGIYTFSCFTNLIGDGNPNNDSFSTTRTVTPNVYITGSPVACIGSNATLQANGATTYTWNTGSNSSSISVSPTVNTSYTVVGTNTAGCSSSYSVTLSIQNPTISTNGAMACNVPSFGTLTASAYSPSVIKWYASPVSTLVLGTGSNLAVTENSTTTYYAEATSTIPGSLFATVAGGNSAQGNMFDVTAQNTMTLDGIDMHFNSNVTTTVEIWYRYGSFVSYELSPAGWTLALSTTVIPNGSGTLTTIPGTFAIPVGSGQTAGIYVTSNGGAGVNYSNGVGLGNLFASNNDIQLFEGRGGNYFNVTSTPRVFNGILKYSKPGCQSPRIPATFSIVPGFTVGAIASNSALCVGSSVSFTAVGAVDYTWSPTINLSPSPNSTIISVSPSVATSYTLQGTIPSCSQTSTYVYNLSVFPNPSLTVSQPIGILPGSVISLSTSGASSYTWQPGGANNINIIVNPTVTTVYTVTGSNAFGCTSQITTTVFMSAVNLSELNNSIGTVMVYPNPVSENLYFKIPENTTGELRILDLNGKVLLEQKVINEITPFDVSRLPSGNYIYIFKPEQGEWYHKGNFFKN
ncbi:MAG: T9SS type A sorting domain-containing protein [Sphingobacteriaceae bacterium]|nr:T9SS type A sorting domain-containing protein [Sphingobacteriaceae bacterium]